MLNNPQNNNFRGGTPYYATVSQSSASAATLMQRVSYLLCTALVVTAGGAYLGRDLPGSLAMLFGIGTFVCVIALNFTRAMPGVNMALLYVLSLLEGLMMGPILAALLHSSQGAQIVGGAVGLTAVIMAGLGSYVWISNKDFSGLGKMLFWALLAFVLVGVVRIFFWSLFSNSHVNMLFLLAGVGIFVGFTLYDFSNIKHQFGPNDYVMATVALYLDFLNLFWLLLEILMSFSGGGSRRN